MPTDVSSLTIEVDSRDVRRGTTDLNNFSQQGRRTETATGRLQGSFNALRVAAASLGGVIGLLSFGKTIAEFQALERALGVVFGSVEDGVKVMEDLQKIATETPFSINELAQSVIKLRSSGIEPTNAQLKLFADIASVTTDKVGTLTAMTDLFARSTAGGLGLEDLNRLADRGIPVFTILKDTLGLARSEVAEFGKTSEGSRKILEALTDDLQERFGGAALDASRDLAVVWSNLGIAFGNLQKEIGDAGGINIFTKAVEGAIKVINFFTADLGRLYTVLGTITAFAIPAIILGIRAIGVAIMANPIGLIITAMTLATLAAYEFRREIGNTIVKTFEVFIPNALDHARIAFINLEVGIGNLMNGMLRSINDFANDLITNSPKWLQDFLGISGDSFRLGIDVNAALAQIDELQNAIAGRTRNFTNPFMIPTATSDTGGGLIDSDSLTGVQGNGGTTSGEEMNRVAEERELALQLTKEFEEKKLELINEANEARLESAKGISDEVGAVEQTMFNNGVNLLRRFAGENKAVAAILIAIKTAQAVKDIKIQATAATVQVLSYGKVEAAAIMAATAGTGAAAAAAAIARSVAAAASISASSTIATGLAIASGVVDFANISRDDSVSSGSGSSLAANETRLASLQQAVDDKRAQQNNTNSAPPAPLVRELRVSIEGDGPHSEGMRKFAVNLAETIKDMGGTTNLVIS
jgi:hypothetical protein